MQVQNIECQLARVQLKRYLAGEELPADLLSDLENHLRNCSDCQKVVDQQKASLNGMAAATPAAPKIKLPNPFAAIVARRPKAESEPDLATPADVLAEPGAEIAPAAQPFWRNRNNLKTLGLTSGLAIVLILMSTVFRDPTAMFGPRALPSKAAPAAKPAPTNEQTPVQAASEAVAAMASVPSDEDPTQGLDGEPVSAKTGVVGEVAGSALRESVNEQQPTETEVAVQTPKPAPAPGPAKEARKLNVPSQPTLGDDVIVASSSSKRLTVVHKPLPKRHSWRTNSQPKHSVGSTRVYAPDGSRLVNPKRD